MPLLYRSHIETVQQWLLACYRARIVSLFFNERFCRIWLAGAWHIVMSRKGTCILSYPLPFISGRNGQAPRRAESECARPEPTRKPTSSVRQDHRIFHRFVDKSLLDPWHLSTMIVHGWVLSYPDAFGVGNDRASPVTKRLGEVPSRRSHRNKILSFRGRILFESIDRIAIFAYASILCPHFNP